MKKRTQADRARAAFTLVELLVVIAIIGILVGLLLPAVQAAREAARRSSCLNNLMQLGLAVHHYEFNMERFPSGVINPDGPIRSEPMGQHVSWIVQVLPFMEERNAYNRFDQAQGAYAPANQPVRHHQIELLLCPSFYAAIGTDQVQSTNYFGCHHDSESPIDTQNNGLLFLNSRIGFDAILDGSSHTILLGESGFDSTSLGWVSGTRATLRNCEKWEVLRYESPTRANVAPNPLQVGGFGSMHTGGANFAFADGSVRFLSMSIQPQVFKGLGNRAGGELLDEVY